MLDSGTNNLEFNRIVKSYAMAWWKGAHKPANGGTLTAKNLEKCFEQHHHLLLETMDGRPMPEHPIIPIPSLQLPIGAVGTDISTNNCTQCTVYKSLAADLLNEMRSIKNFVSGMARTTSNETELIPHRALGFYSLHEKVLTKEFVSESQSVIVKHKLSGTKKGKMSLQVHEDANKELKHLWAMPTASHKWTWGESLTQDEVRSLHHMSKKRVRSGYETSLKPGIHDGENITLARAAASQIPQTVQPPFIAVENLQATASSADIGIIGTDIQRLPNLPCISPSIIPDMWINTSPSPPPCFLQYRSG